VKAHLYLGRTLRMTGSFERSRNHLERARELAPRSAEAELELGLLDLELHRISLSREHLERARTLDPEGETGKRASYELTHLGEHEVVRRRAVGETPRPSRAAKLPRDQRWIKLC
jgi:tetratricopeptide (TPR) repeat protein